MCYAMSVVLLGSSLGVHLLNMGQNKGKYPMGQVILQHMHQVYSIPFSDVDNYFKALKIILKNPTCWELMLPLSQCKWDLTIGSGGLNISLCEIWTLTFSDMFNITDVNTLNISVAIAACLCFKPALLCTCSDSPCNFLYEVSVSSLSNVECRAFVE
ncbi:hypothetical protein BS47DRAFT_1418883 [Hydnum rufescens UP504]|uniref:Uncharacterized protein n=1 Tax=Hydnum rufescens UP504 TaxID=1448309 RepID=A0A9P6DMG6_9AGAM|nr:hypothetical protein BS47DRAFT_1418883 [Hydnum rufescens UP504]